METASHVVDDDDDPVVRELDVFLSHALANSSYLLQFPLQSAQTDAADLLGTTTECRKKIDFEMAGVTKPLASFSMIAKAGHRIVLETAEGSGGYIQNKKTGSSRPFEHEDEVGDAIRNKKTGSRKPAGTRRRRPAGQTESEVRVLEPISS